MNPRILLVEDDPVSAAFLSASAAALPAQVDVAGSLADALRYTTRHDYALWLFDAHLPDGAGADLLARLRAQALRTPALAHTAAQDRIELDALIDAGFIEVLIKPLSAAALQAAIRRALGIAVESSDMPMPPRCGKLPVWDDAAAIAALNGNRAHVDALRQLCLGELPLAGELVRRAAQTCDSDALRTTLHKLRASCGFVGAARLDAAVRALQDAPESVEALAQFEGALQDTLSSR